MTNEHEDADVLWCGRPQPTLPWGPHGGRRRREQVAYSQRSGGYAFRPGHFHCLDRSSAIGALQYLNDVGLIDIDTSLAPEDHDTELVSPIRFLDDHEPEEFLVIVADDVEVDVEFHIDELRDRGHNVDPNYVLFTDAGPDDEQGIRSSPVFGSPVFGSPVFGSPVFGSPVFGSANSGGGQFAGTTYASPVFGSPVFGSPVFGSPVFGSNYKYEGMRSNTARPVVPREVGEHEHGQHHPQTIVILDTGLAERKLLPHFLSSRIDNECGECVDDPPDQNDDGYYDPASGHGTFIAGLVEQVAPNRRLIVRRVLSSFGDGDIARDIVPMLNHLRRLLKHHDDFDAHQTIVNLSFSGYADREMSSLARAVRRLRKTGAVVVASAGNDATSRPTFPACLPGVVGVGALSDVGPAAFTNYGPWVRACAPGNDLISTFYLSHPHAEPEASAKPEAPAELPVPPLPGSGDPTHFEGWARWSGTSFSAPIVAAVLARYMSHAGCSANDAVDATIDAPGLLRIAGLGAVVNVMPLMHDRAGSQRQ